MTSGGRRGSVAHLHTCVQKKTKKNDRVSFLPVKSSAVDLVNLWALGSWLSLDYSMVSLVRYLNAKKKRGRPGNEANILSQCHPFPLGC